VTTEPCAQTELARVCAEHHPDCFACRPREEGGLGLRFETDGDRGVRAAFPCDAEHQGYPGRLHGGIVATLLDAAMTHCLFALGTSGYTGRLNVRYRLPVEVDQDAVVCARVTRCSPPLYVLEAELEQGGRVRALAEGKFLGRDEATPAE